ncbi:peptidoglycan-associated lipoprotein Pal [Azoarcus sp. KH32C]|uniref:peptidoglycan-associated lipoprotein Pal n=1 Tax=Azoarcus sp. KH32C TaxID=748247 RepID=UPI0002386C4C|nr:peptidoglycan-associated lipoprotein Pal [Azoarcus sp. KH32C]BAL23848.1 peptidoglycan-associated lipoprotein [Azoarcus sp. KH32C]
MRRIVAVVAVSALLAACSSNPVKTEAEAPASTAKSMPAAAQPTANTETDAQRMARIIKTLAANSVYFDYDDYSVKAQYHDILKQDYDFLKSSPQVRVTVTGNADERGSTEYNLALGQKRAEAVARALRTLGVPDAQLEAVSYGEEKPRAACHEEKCWTENRRADFSFK